jgi:hypothetical protein
MFNYYNNYLVEPERKGFFSRFAKKDGMGKIVIEYCNGVKKIVKALGTTANTKSNALKFLQDFIYEKHPYAIIDDSLNSNKEITSETKYNIDNNGYSYRKSITEPGIYVHYFKLTNEYKDCVTGGRKRGTRKTRKTRSKRNKKSRKTRTNRK